MASSVDLDWLQPAPADFCAGLKFDPADPQLGARLQQLALHRLDSTMAGAFGRAVSRLIRAGANLFRVKKGNYLGQNFGVITSIDDAAINLRELVQDSGGEWVERNSALSLVETKK